MKKSGLGIFLRRTIHGDKTPNEVISFIPYVEFYVKLPMRISQHFHGICPNTK
jgi:hypothetical protein